MAERAEAAKDNAPKSKFAVRMRAIKRLVLWHGFSGILPLYLVSEYPKSGGTWFSRMLAECLEVPFPDPWANHRFETCVMRGHHLHRPTFRNTVAVYRDGRDVMVSSYYFFLFPTEKNHLPYGVERSRNRLQFKDYDDIYSNLPRFIEYMFLEFPKIGWSIPFNWSQFVDSWRGKANSQVKYEDLLATPHETLTRVVKELAGKEVARDRLQEIIDKYSFEKMTGRKRGSEARNAFARKGVAGDWKNHFSPEARQVFDAFAGNHLIELGYEQDHEWVHRPAEAELATSVSP